MRMVSIIKGRKRIKNGEGFYICFVKGVLSSYLYIEILKYLRVCDPAGL